MNILYYRKITGCESKIIKNLLKEMLACIKTWNNLSDEDEYEFKLIFNELIANSAIHGNKSLCNKTITVKIEALDNKTVNITVQDEGEGFNYQDIYNGLYPCDLNPYLERGRGLKLVMAMCDDVVFNSIGNQIKIKKSVYNR